MPGAKPSPSRCSGVPSRPGASGSSCCEAALGCRENSPLVALTHNLLKLWRAGISGHRVATGAGNGASNNGYVSWNLMADRF